MMLAVEYIVSKFYEYCGYPRYKKLANVYEGCCPICREGTSWGKKRRCYYIVKKNQICCHNCGWNTKPLEWIVRMTGKTEREIFSESRNFNVTTIRPKEPPKKKTNSESLPKDSINIFDSIQVEYHNSKGDTLKQVLSMVKERKLETAINRPKTLWYSPVDLIHKNRLVIPFYNEVGKIVFYQTRALDGSYPKYLSKVNSDKTLFNIDRIQADIPYIFLFEGPIDAFFVQNGIAVAGIQEKAKYTLTPIQSKQLQKFPFHEKIWVLDSQWQDFASHSKTQILIEQDQKVFIWPKELGMKYKDINEVCCGLKRDFVAPKFFTDNSFTGVEAKLRLSLIAAPQQK